MKKSIFTVAVLLLTFASAPAVAASYCDTTIQQARCQNSTQTFTGLNCATSSHFCWGGYDVTSCTSCKSGYKLSELPLSSDDCTNTYQYNTCMYSGGIIGGCGTSCDDCVALKMWTNVSGNIGYQQQPTTAKCDESTNCECVLGYEYRCNAGYYGRFPRCTTTENGGTSCSGCSKCPDVPGKVDWVDESYSITSAPGSRLPTQCYIDGTASDHYIADETGHFMILGGKCYYSTTN
ncbi:MAG TPA: hypothetical protein IAC63_02940 [Candidatus Enterousia avicola]|uniref:TNFR-Cys domain-containing protein n=1 Tax=Candidatus Enterousia avicola TaxID=2840787 RepID=A0A9D1SME4_9PROT|nr:hypothetical protein [Candidatus Enterousia avicola]